jgi:2-methylcitrate dehydratase PrpD
MGHRSHAFDREAEFEVAEQSRDSIVDFVTGLRWKDLPARVQRQASMCILDALGAMLAGTRVPAAWISADYALATLPGSSATVVARGRPSSTLGAAFANGVAANGIDVDDCGIYTWGHPGAQIVPAALAVAEERRMSGRALLEALVVGYEIAFRAARCSHDFHDVYRSCGSWGSVACAAVAARLMGLSKKETSHALGIADYDSPFLPMMRDIDHPAMVKHGIGVGALTGIMSAQLAERGFTGTPALIETTRYQTWVGDLGERYLLDGGVTWKEHSCCAWTHPALLALTKVRKAHDIDPERVVRIEVETFHQACRLHVKAPMTTEEAQFSLPWTLAVMLVDGEVGPDQVLETRLGDPQVARLAASVVSRSNDEFTELHALAEDFDPAGMDPAVVRIRLDDGTVFDSGVVDFPLRQMSREELRRKFHRVAGSVLGCSQREAVIELVEGLDEEAGVAGLVAALLPAGTEAGSLSSSDPELASGGDVWV